MFRRLAEIIERRSLPVVSPLFGMAGRGDGDANLRLPRCDANATSEKESSVSCAPSASSLSLPAVPAWLVESSGRHSWKGLAAGGSMRDDCPRGLQFDGCDAQKLEQNALSGLPCRLVIMNHYIIEIPIRTHHSLHAIASLGLTSANVFCDAIFRPQ